MSGAGDQKVVVNASARRIARGGKAKAHFGELVQMDGSFHAWLEERGEGGCMMNLVDDATTETLLRLGEQETIRAAVGALRRWIEKYGVPCALYTDWKNVYVREPNASESGKQLWTHGRRQLYESGQRQTTGECPSERKPGASRMECTPKVRQRKW